MEQTLSFPKQKAADFYNAHFSSSFGGINSATKFQDDLVSDFYFFKRPNDQHAFLIFLHKIINNEQNRQLALNFGHTDYEIDAAIFVIEQEIEEISQRLEKTQKTTEKFSGSEQSEIFSKIDQIISELQKTHAGQEVLFNEINELKEHLDLGKKTFSQLLIGKVFEMTASSLIDKTIGTQIFQTLSVYLKNVTGYIDSIN